MQKKTLQQTIPRKGACGCVSVCVLVGGCVHVWCAPSGIRCTRQRRSACKVECKMKEADWASTSCTGGTKTQWNTLVFRSIDERQIKRKLKLEGKRGRGRVSKKKGEPGWWARRKLHTDCIPSFVYTTWLCMIISALPLQHFCFKCGTVPAWQSSKSIFPQLFRFVTIALAHISYLLDGRYERKWAKQLENRWQTGKT